MFNAEDLSDVGAQSDKLNDDTNKGRSTSIYRLLLSVPYD